jgi:hypothetical protein
MSYPCDLSSSNITKPVHSQAILLHIINSPSAPVFTESPNAFLMLNFANNASRRLNGSSIGYTVSINSTDFNFEKKTTTSTGLDIKVIRDMHP